MEFLNEMKIINPDISFLDDYNGISNKIRCVCTICGNQWKATPDHLLHGRGCPECAKIKQALKLRKTHEQFVSEIYCKNSNIEVLGKYCGSNTPVDVKCKKCGYIWAPVPSSLLSGTGCPQCAGNIKRTHKEFIEKLKTIDPTIEVLEKYINTDTNLKVKCKKCGRIWYSSPNNLLDGHGCRRCSVRKDHNEFIKELSTINPDIEVLGNYIDRKTHIPVRCKKCGYEWKSKPSQLLGGHGCHKCAIKTQAGLLRKTQNQFEEELEHINPNITILGEYKNSMTPIKVKCKKCDYVWDGFPNNLLRGQGCPRCAKYLHTSYPEQTIYYYIKSVFTDAINSYKALFEKNMEIDIFIPSMNYGIEYDGKAWHSGDKAYKREIKKYLACKEHNIKLIRVKELKQENDYSTADVIIYTEKTLDKTLKKVADTLDVEFDIDLIRDRDNIFGQYKSTNTNDEFLRKLEKINPSVTPLSRYTLSSNKINCRCEKCGYEWMATPNKLLMGRGCPKCSGRMKKNTAQFIEELESVNPNIEVIGEYKNSLSPINVRCKICSHEWSPSASSLLVGNGCPKCSHRIRISHEQFVEELNSINESIEVLGRYITMRTPILVRCKKCGREWQATPDSLLRNHGCAKCAGTIRKTTDEFIKELAKVNDRFQVIGEYVNAKTKIKVVCKDCGFERTAVPYSLLKGLRCPNCDK
jgi:predicted  nucleic acid-binding Zn-ribbon protein